MPDEIELEGVEDDDLTEDTPAPGDSPAGTEPKEPLLEAEAEIERRVQEHMAAVETEWTQREQERLLQTIKETLAEEQRSEASARKRLRDLETRTGMTHEALLESAVAQEVERLVWEEGFSERAAQEYVRAKHQTALREAEEADTRQMQAESRHMATYRDAKARFLADPNTPDVYKKAARKLSKEIDSFARHGRPDADGRAIAYDVAASYIIGTKLPDLVEEWNKETATKAAKATPQVEKKAPAKVEAPPEVRKLALAFDLDPDEVAKKWAARQKAKAPSDKLTPAEEATAHAFGYTPERYLQAKMRAKS